MIQWNILQKSIIGTGMAPFSSSSTEESKAHCSCATLYNRVYHPEGGSNEASRSSSGPNDETTGNLLCTDSRILRHVFVRDGSHVPPCWNAVCGPQVGGGGGSPGGCFGHTAVLHGREMYVFGGRGDEGMNSDVWCFDLDTKEWIQYAAPVGRDVEWPAGRSGHAAVATENCMFVLSGERQRGHCLPDMWSFDFNSKTWRLESASLPFEPRKGHTLHYLRSVDTAKRSRHSMLVVFGGSLNDGSMSNDVYLYNLESRQWKKLRAQGDVPLPRAFHVSHLIEQTAKLLVFGGRTAAMSSTIVQEEQQDDSYLNDLLILDVSTGVWSRVYHVKGLPPTPRTCCASVFANGMLAIFCGGNSDGYCSEGYEFSLPNREWRSFAIMNQPSCSRPTIIYTEDQLVLFGGCSSSGCLLDQTLFLSLPSLSLRDQCDMWLRQSDVQRQLLRDTAFHHSSRIFCSAQQNSEAYRNPLPYGGEVNPKVGREV